MGNSIRKILYSFLFIACLLLGIVGIFNDPDSKQEKTDNTTTEEYVICNIKTDTYTDTTNTTIDYTTSNAVTLVLKDGSITGKAVNVTIIYQDEERYTTRKNKLVSAGANYEFDDTSLTIKYKKSLEQSLIEGVAANKTILEAHLTSLGYTC